MENRALRERLSRLSEASLRVNASLDLDAVLRGALDAARSLTGVRYRVITLLDDAGRVQDFLASGTTREETRRLWDTPDGTRIFDYLGSLSQPLRIADLLGLVRQLGIPGFRPPFPVDGPVSFWRRRPCTGASGSPTSLWPDGRRARSSAWRMRRRW